MAKAEISLRGRAYSIACAPGQEQRLVTLSRELDGRIGRISDAVGDIGDERLFLVAALSLLDELHAARRPGAASAEIEKRAASALIDAAARIEALVQRAETRDREGPDAV